MTRQRVLRASELPVGGLRRFDVGGVPVCVAHAEDGGFYAIADTCTHEQQSLSEGELFGMAVECPMHSSLFDVRTGAATGAPARLPVRVYPTDVEDGEVWVEV
jgi:3-phenylpropionate/trans-cinnamate dioxygenase ferredoxin component